MLSRNHTKLTVVVGGQFGSEGKGAVTERLARTATDVIRVGGPNAGHVIEDEKGRRFKLQQIPAGALNQDCRLHIAAGSEIDIDILEREIRELEMADYSVRSRLTIHPQATVLESSHADEEEGRSMHKRIGSTGKGVGAARADRIWRNARIAQDEPRLLGYLASKPRRSYGSDVVLEGTQGYGLGLHAGWYPKCTSIDCCAIDMLAMAGISPWDPAYEEFQIWLVARAYPIRVAGDSGPLRGETSWDQLGLPEERTTVTNKVRRVGRWDSDLVAAAVDANGGEPAVRVAFTMADHLFPELGGVDQYVKSAGQLSKHVAEHVRWLEHSVGAGVTYLGTGPRTGIEIERAGW
jgi:adenylosuccinate synthase